MISFLAIYISTKELTDKKLLKYTYGYHRIEILGGILSVFLILVFCGLLVVDAITKLTEGNYEITGWLMLVLAGYKLIRSFFFIGILVNCSCFPCCKNEKSPEKDNEEKKNEEEKKPEQVIQPNNEEKKEGISEKKEEEKKINKTKYKNEIQSLCDDGSEGENVNLRAAIINISGDVFRQLTVIIVSICVMAKSDLALLDPILSIINALIIVFSTRGVLKDCILILMEGIPEGADVEKMKENFLSIDSVKEVHDLHL